ncbi:hypothetical protein V1281_000403 [Nitrobacteraceae bacterium AZCC 2161]
MSAVSANSTNSIIFPSLNRNELRMSVVTVLSSGDEPDFYAGMDSSPVAVDGDANDIAMNKVEGFNERGNGRSNVLMPLRSPSNCKRSLI